MEYHGEYLVAWLETIYPVPECRKLESFMHQPNRAKPWNIHRKEAKFLVFFYQWQKKTAKHPFQIHCGAFYVCAKAG